MSSRDLSRFAALAGLFLACATAHPVPAWWEAPERSLEARCRSDEVDACGELGRLLLQRGRPSADRERGLALLEHACGRDDAPSCLVLGRVYGDEPQPTAQRRARELLEGTCQRTLAEACTAWGELETRGGAWREASEAFRKGCLLGDARACEGEAVVQLRDASHGDRTVAERSFLLACKNGRISSCHQWALLGLADENKRPGALAILAQACQAGHAPSCLTAARAYAPLLGFESDCGRAKAFALQGCSPAQGFCAIADACSLGEAPPQSSPAGGGAALKRLAEGCDLRDPLACLYWGEAMRSAGTAGPATREAYEKAADSQDAEVRELASVRLSELVLAETKVGTEAAHALDQLRDACSRGSRAACCAWADASTNGRWMRPDPGLADKARQDACKSGRCCSLPDAPRPAAKP